MALLNLDSLDDPVLVDACPGFASGQRSFGPADQLQVTEARRLVNMDIGDGAAATRRGAETLGSPVAGVRIQGLWWYGTPAREYLVAAAGAGLWKWDGNAWAPFSAYVASSAETRVCFAQLVDRLYIAEGASNLHMWDGTALTDLSTGGSNQPPIGSIVISAQNRLWMAGVAEVPDALYVSAFIDGGVWDATNRMIRIGAGEGDPITGLAEWDDYQVVVFKRNSVYIVRAEPSATHGADVAHSLANATVTKISETIGCVAHRTIARVAGDLWFLARGGVYSLGRVLAQTQREIKPAASLPVQDVLERVNWNAAGDASAVFWNHRYMLALPLDDETSPGTVLVYHAQRLGWCGQWTGWGPLCWAVSRAGDEERLNFGRADGAVWRWLDYVPAVNEVESTYEDAGTNIASLVETRAMIFGEAISRKSALSMQAEFHGSRAVATVAVRVDEDEPMQMRADVATHTGELILPFRLPAAVPALAVKRRAFGAQHLAAFRSLQAEISARAGKLVVRGVMASAFRNTVTLEE